jgi:hypothetical protein
MTDYPLKYLNVSPIIKYFSLVQYRFGLKSVYCIGNYWIKFLMEELRYFQK